VEGKKKKQIVEHGLENPVSTIRYATMNECYNKQFLINKIRMLQ
jgi:hypothetical protein